MRKIAEKTDIGNIFWRWKNSPPHGHFSFCNIGVHMLWTDFGNTLNSKKWTKRIHKWKKIDKKQVSKVYRSIRSRQNFLCRNNFQQKSLKNLGGKSQHSDKISILQCLRCCAMFNYISRWSTHTNQDQMIDRTFMGVLIGLTLAQTS